jgi:hypothetical protein
MNNLLLIAKQVDMDLKNLEISLLLQQLHRLQLDKDHHD